MCFSKIGFAVAECKGIYIEGGKEGYEVIVARVDCEALKKRGEALKMGLFYVV